MAKKYIEILDANDKDSLDFAMNTDGSSSDYMNDRDRPYNGQPWTVNGIRGKQKVKGITMRDITDCLIQAFLVCADPSIPDQFELTKKVFEISDDPDVGKGTEYAGKGNWRTQDVYKVDLSRVNPIAVAQNLNCFIEHYMGIYPNLKLEGIPSSDELFNELFEGKGK
jgi:hypothetical protein